MLGRDEKFEKFVESTPSLPSTKKETRGGRACPSQGIV